jgi:hypothetical protein
MTRLRWVNVAALVGGAVGLMTAWGTVFFVSVNGIDTDDGKVFGVLVVVAALLLWWRVNRTIRINGVLLVVVWLGLLVIAVYEIIHLSTSSRLVSVGFGLYVDAIAAAVGVVTAVKEARLHWARIP